MPENNAETPVEKKPQSFLIYARRDLKWGDFDIPKDLPVARIELIADAPFPVEYVTRCVQDNFMGVAQAPEVTAPQE